MDSSLDPNSLGNKLIRKYDQLTRDMGHWQTHWDEVSEYIIPRKDNIYGQRNKLGEKKHNLLYDSSAIDANEKLASALHSMLTSPSNVWFGLSTGVQELDRIQQVAVWLTKTANTIIRTLNNTNFQTEVHEVYLDLGSFGTGSLRIEEDDEKLLRFHARPIYDMRVAENYKGIIDTVYYEYELSLAQIIHQFGKEALTEDMLREASENDQKKEKLIHGVEPRTNQIGMKGPKGYPFASFHVLKKTKHIVKESGFHENPYVIPRWTKIAGEVFGRSPGMKALADIKMLNKMKKAFIEASQLAISPPLQVPDEGVLLPVRLQPNSVNYYRAGTKDRIEPLITGNNLPLGDVTMEKVREQIKEAFFIDQLKIVESDRMTATEVSQRRDEQLRMLGPILGRQHFEFLQPLVKRVYGILARKGTIEPPPSILIENDVSLEVQYTSQIARVQKTQDADSIQRALGLIAPMLEIKPEMADYINPDEFVKQVFDMYSAPPSLLKSDQEVQKLRAERQEAEAAQAQMMEQQHDAEVISKVGPLQQK